MALPAGSVPAPVKSPLPSPEQVAAKTNAQNGAMTSKVSPANTLPNSKQVVARTRAQNGGLSKSPAKRRLAAAAASPAAGGGAPAAPVNPYQARAQAEIDPIIAAITAAATGQASSADQAIQGLTDSYAKGISGIDYGAPYAGAEAQQAAVDAALQQSATGQGSSLAAALSQSLQALQGSSGAGAVQQEANQLASQGAGAGQAQLADGSAALNQLISDAAAAKGYGEKMPGVIDSAGLQGIGQSQGQAQQAINQGTLQAESQLPQIEQTLRADALQSQATKQTQAYRQAEVAAKNAALGLTAAKDRASLAQGQERINVSRLRAAVAQNQGDARIQIEAQRAAQSALNENRNYKLALGRLGIANQKAQLQALTDEAKLKNGGYTPSEVQHLSVTAAGLAANAFSGIPATHYSNGSVKSAGYPPLSFQKAMIEMQKEGIPPSIALKELTLAGYKPGVKGRPGPALSAGAAAMFNSLRSGSGMPPFGAKTGRGGMATSLGGKPSTNAGGFLQSGAKFTYNRHDQGRDIQTSPGAPIIAPGDGYVVRIASDPGGGGGHFGPSYPIVHFTTGPYAGKDVYIGHTVAAVRPGQKFRAGATLSRTQQSGPMNGGAPSGWAEIGFAPGATPGVNGQPAPF